MPISPLPAENVAFLQRVSQMVLNDPQRFACAGRFLDDGYSKAAYRARLENELRRDIGDLPSGHPWRVSCQEKYNRESLSSPRARCEAAINDLLHRFKCDDFFHSDMNPTEAASIILLTAIGDCPEIQPTESACEFQRLPWQWDAEVDGHLYQGRVMLREHIRSADWLELVSFAEVATIALVVDPESWVTLTEAETAIEVNKGTIARSAGPDGSGKPIIDNGEARNRRRIFMPSAWLWKVARTVQGRDETNEQVEGKMRRVGG